ncbi:MAG: hypothetical protein ACRDIY_07150 [Chloroflexota bacterium]
MIQSTIESAFATVGRLTRSRWVRQGAPLVVLIASLGIMGRLIVREYASITIDLHALNPVLILVGLLAIVVSNLGGGFFWKKVLASCGAELDLKESVRIWCLASPAKYAFSFVSLYAGRVYLAERAGVPRRALLVSIPVELILIVLSGVIVLLLLAPFGGSIPVLGGSVLPRFVAPLLAVIVAGLLPSLVRWAIKLVPRGWVGDRATVTYPRMRAGLLVAIVNWLFLGAASYFLVDAMMPIRLTLLPFCICAVVLALLSGLVGITPLGMGVREVVLVLILAQVIPIPIATTVAILHRLLTVLAELLCGGIALAASSRSGTRPFKSEVPDVFTRRSQN